MAAESNQEVGESVTPTEPEIKKTKKSKGVLSRLWQALFGVREDDFEKRLQNISKEEVAVLGRITRRSQSWRRMTRNLIIFSVLLEVIAVSYAIMTTRSLMLDWQMRALRVLPMFLLPALSISTYSALRSYTKMRDRKDRQTLERLQGERQEKINELKERTNYYITQQLIQRYDPDPAAKAAAATVLASKLGADSGLRVYLGDESMVSDPTGKSNDVEVARTTGLRNRKLSQSRENASKHHNEGGLLSRSASDGADVSQEHQLVVGHHPQAGLSTNDGGWIARLAALLVGEDPTQSYALICGNCHMHNGLARKEDFPYITYYCPHCHALNGPKQSGELASSSSSAATASLTTMEDTDVVPSADVPVRNAISASNSPVAATTTSEISES